MPWPPYGRSESGAEFLDRGRGLPARSDASVPLMGLGIVRPQPQLIQARRLRTGESPQEGLDSLKASSTRVTQDPVIV